MRISMYINLFIVAIQKTYKNNTEFRENAYF